MKEASPKCVPKMKNNKFNIRHPHFKIEDLDNVSNKFHTPFFRGKRFFCAILKAFSDFFLIPFPTCSVARSPGVKEESRKEVQQIILQKQTNVRFEVENHFLKIEDLIVSAFFILLLLL